MALPTPGDLVGGFRLEGLLGRGGMGEVWSARSADGVDAAVKLVPVGGREDRERARAEVRAIAGLDHPSIARVYDLGEGPDHVWLAMERGLAEPLRTSLDRRVTQVLEALAHAHARGVIHRDLKPANLVQLPGDRVMLVDFGISVGPGAEVEASPSAGSLPFMAPEQIRGQVDDQGPWTDLYALGCTVWAWVTGGSPFTTPEAHLTAPLPDADVPPALREWVAALTDKQPYRRPRSAAHALALWRGAGAEAAGGVSTVEPTALTLTRFEAHRFDLDQPLRQWEHEALELPAGLEDVSPLRLDRRHLDGGLALVALREPPLVGRSAEREALWRALRASVSAPRAAWIAGPPGRGSRRLVRWLARRAAEHGAVALQGDSVGELVRAALRLGRVSDRAVRAAVWRMDLPERSAPLLLELARGGLPAGWLGAVVDTLAAVGLPLVLGVPLPDPHGPEVRLARALHERGVPGLFLATGAEIAPDWPGEVLELAPLAEAERRAVAAGQLYLDPATTAQLAAVDDEVGGVVRAVRQVAADGLLEPGPVGFRLRAGAVLSLPAPPPTEAPLPLPERLARALAADDGPAAIALARSWGGPASERIAHPRYRELLQALVLGDEPDAVAGLAEAAEARGDVERALEARLAEAKAAHAIDPDRALRATHAALQWADTPARRARRDLAEASLLFYAQRDPESASLADGIPLDLLEPGDRVEWLRLRGQRAMVEGDPAGALERLQEALDRCRDHGMPGRTEVPLLATLGVVAYLAGDLERAERMYLDAIHRYGGPEAPDASQTVVNLAYLWLTRERFDEARALLDVLIPPIRRTGRRRPLAYALVARWSVAERSEDAAAWFAEGSSAVDELGLEDADFARLAERVVARWSGVDEARVAEARSFLARRQR